MAAWIGDDGTVLDDRAAGRVLARAALFWKGEESSSLACARGESRRLVRGVAGSCDFYWCRSGKVIDGI